MGERKGQNHYYPPDYDPKKGGLNKFLGTHALRERARKLHLGILIIRFEMPYNIWCDGCQQHVGMGVRFNAEKTKVGMYYSTPIYQFKMKCTACDTHYVIKTDPGNLDYVIVSGARRQENRWDPTDNGQVVPDDRAVQRRLFDDAMFKLEHGAGDEKTAQAAQPRVAQLVQQREERWRDDYAANAALRRSFRTRRRELKALASDDAELLTRSSLDLKLLPETEEDRKMAHLLSLAPSKSLHERSMETVDRLMQRPALPGCYAGSTTGFLGTRADNQLKHSVSVGVKTRNGGAGAVRRTAFTAEKKVEDGEERLGKKRNEGDENGLDQFEECERKRRKCGNEDIVEREEKEDAKRKEKMEVCRQDGNDSIEGGNHVTDEHAGVLVPAHGAGVLVPAHGADCEATRLTSLVAGDYDTSSEDDS